MNAITTLTWVTLALSAGMVIRGVRRSAAYRERGEKLPPYYAGNIAGGLATMLLLGGTLMREHEALQWLLLAGAVICMAIDAIQSRNALRQR